jgi:hypothetical protein
MLWRLVLVARTIACRIRIENHDHGAKNQSKTASLYPSIRTDAFGQEIEDEMVCSLCTITRPRAHLF